MGRVGFAETNSTIPFWRPPRSLRPYASRCSATLSSNPAQLGNPSILRQPEVDEARAGDLGARDQPVRRQSRDDGLRQLARTPARRLGETHGDVAGEIAVLRIARSLDHHLVRGG